MSEAQATKLYENHKGTVVVSGHSPVGKVARYIVHLINEGVENVEVMFIGANAGQQAYKSCSIAQSVMREEYSRRIAFEADVAPTETEKQDVTGATQVDELGEPEKVVKDAFIWRIVHC